VTAGPPDRARAAAYQLLRAVAARDAYANLVLPGLLRERQIEGRDAALATELGYGTLRWLGSLDAVLAAAASRPLAEIDPPLLDALRIGAYQLLHLRVPAHAAVSTTVDLTRAAVGPGPAKFANAVLRRVAQRDWEGWLGHLATGDPASDLGLRYGYPTWIVHAFADSLTAVGAGAELAAALAAGSARPAVSLVARPGRIARAELLAEAGPEARASDFSPLGVELAAGDPGDIPAVADGRAAVQDVGSQLVALAMAAPALDADQHWLDLAAGPGGKAAVLAGIAGARGARLLAVEPSAHRARLTMRTLDGAAVVVQADGRVPAWRTESFDRVLLDAPCSGLGALRRRPESRWRRGPADVARLAGLQRELLSAGLDAVRPGGLLGYATCSPHLAETRTVVAGALDDRPQLTLVDARPFFAGVPDLGAGPDVQLWPHRHGTDAMYFALIRVGERT